jgi:hypothetical protein
MMKIACFGLIACLFISGCNKDNSDSPSVLIKGKISQSTKGSPTKSANAFSLNEATKVLAFYGSLYSLSDIKDGSFSVRAELGSATALVFLNADNKYIGNLFAGGLNVLPLNNLQDGENTVIDLQNLDLDGTSVIPSHNPIGNEINLTSEEVTRIKELGGFFESLAKNIDADNDGVPDILSKHELRITSHFSIEGGHWGDNIAPASDFNINHLLMSYAVRIEGNISMAPANGSHVALSGPEAEPYTDIRTSSYIAEKDCFITFFRRDAPATTDGQTLPPFKKGTYTFTLDGSKKFTLNYANIDAKYYMVIATPMLNITDGKVTSVSIEYKLPDNRIVSPDNFVTILQLQFNNKDGSRQEIGSLYESVKTDNTLTDFKYVTLKSPIEVSNLGQLSVNYNDFLGNEYDVIWR